MEKKSTKPVNFESQLLIRLSNLERERITKYAKQKNTSVSKLLRNYINSLPK
jgi:hypothetical protein